MTVTVMCQVENSLSHILQLFLRSFIHQPLFKILFYSIQFPKIRTSSLVSEIVLITREIS